ncbi:MAG: TRAP transporter small permease [Ferrovum sp.]|nr:TRAP transporter small permease [Ferrovum sp.]
MSNPPQQGPLRIAATGLMCINRFVVMVSMVAVIAACLVLTAGVVMRYLFNTPTDWQDEISMFLLVGSIFSCGAAVQAQRGHIGIEAVAGLLPAWLNRLRMWLCDITSLLFCSFFSWKSWTLLYEAWSEGMTTSSTWAPPLWIPYGLMSVGMTLLSLQLLIQVLAGPAHVREAA